MIKKIIFSILLLIYIIPISVNASANSLAKVGDKYYDNLLDAISNVGPNDTITLISNAKLDNTLVINKPVNINLNGNDITAPEIVFLVQGGTLNLTGKGTIKETSPNYGSIMIKGSTNRDDKDYSVVNISKDITLEGWSGIFITHDNNKSYGTKVNFSGTINAVDDTNGGEGIGIYVNGKIKDKHNSPIVNIQDGAKIISTGNGLYFAGYGTYNINKSDISGVESGIGIKAGILNIDGATVTGTGPDETPTEGYNNGIKASGTSIQIESNTSYAGNVEINIDSGTFVSNHSNVIYEYIGKGTGSQVIALDVSGGTFVSDANKNVIRITDSLKEYHNSFISGGKYSSNPNEYLKPGYISTLDNDKYIVAKSTMKSVIGSNIKEGNSNLGIIFIVSIITLSILAYLYVNRVKIFNSLKNN